MAKGHHTCVGDSDAMRNQLSLLLSEEQHSVESVAVAVEVLTNSGYLPPELLPIAKHILDAHLDLSNRIALFFEAKAEARHAA